MSSTPTKQPVFRDSYETPHFLVESIALTFELHPAATRVTNTMRIRRQSGHLPLVLDGEKIILESVRLDGKILPATHFTCTETQLTIPQVPESFELVIQTVCNPKANTALDGLYLSNNIFCTQCEPHGFRKITYYIDRPDVMTMFTTTIIADPEHYPVLLSNGNCVSEEFLPDGRKKVVWFDPFKKPCYLFALVGGDLGWDEDHFITASGRRITLRIFVEKGNEAKTHFAMEMLKEAMRWDEINYGREYDLDIFMIVAVSDFNMGAMENKGLNVFNAKYILASADTATDADYEGIAQVVSHEYFHNWTGNRITCRDWFQLSLKEGLTVFRDQEFTSDLISRPMTRIDDVRMLRTVQFTEDAGPLAHPVRPESYVEMNNFYTATVYNKGAEVVRMLHTLQGPEGFRKGMDLYFDRFDGMAVTCDDFADAHAEANARDYAQFKRWYSQAGTPQLSFSDQFDIKNSHYVLTVTQAISPSADKSPKEPFHIPIRFALFDRDSGKKLHQETLELQKAQQDFSFSAGTVKPLPSFLHGFSAPVRWSYPYTLEERIFLLRYEDDAFNRFEMAQQIFLSCFQAEEPLPETFLQVLKNILQDEKLDATIKSRFLMLPSYREFSDSQEKIQVEKTIRVRKAMFKQMATFFAPEAHHTFMDLQAHHQSYRFDAIAVGRRALMAWSLSILVEAGEPSALNFAQDLYAASDNMTDRYNAMVLLAHHADEVSRIKVLENFFQCYKNDPLVMEKWLAVQATLPEMTALQKIKQLLSHPSFDLKNPNKVRALLGSFAQQNFEGFHLPDGAAYEFFADQMLALDQINPIISARQIEPLTRWKRYEDTHAVLIRSALQKVALAPSLSTDLREVVDKSI